MLTIVPKRRASSDHRACPRRRSPNQVITSPITNKPVNEFGLKAGAVIKVSDVVIAVD